MKKFIIYSLILTSLFGCLTIGVVAIITGNSYKNNRVSFVAGSEDAYCSISAQYFYNGEEKVEQRYDKVSYTETVRYSKEGFAGFGSWKNLEKETFFNPDYVGDNPEKLEYVINITNLNEETDLYVSLLDVAVGEQMPTQGEEIYFYTTITYKINDASEQVVFCNKEDVKVNYDELYVSQGSKQKVSLNTLSSVAKIPVDSSLKISLIMERKTKVSEFSIENAIKVNISTTAPAVA